MSQGVPPAHLRSASRSTYGENIDAYNAGRPGYPDAVYEILERRCGIAGSRVLEIGPGPGTATRRIIDTVRSLVAVEPDTNFAAHLKRVFVGTPLTVIESTFEDADLADGTFDVALSAMAFHWVDQQSGLPKLGRVVRPGGAVALWWTAFDDPTRSDSFRDLLQPTWDTFIPPSGGGRFELDVDARIQDLSSLARLSDATGELIDWTSEFPTGRLIAFYSSLIAVRRLDDVSRRRLLEAVSALAVEAFGGVVTRSFVTAIYTGRKLAP